MTTNSYYVLRSPEARARMQTWWVEGQRPLDTDIVVVSDHGDALDVENTVEITYDHNEIQDWFDGSIPDIVLDLIEIALATFAIDKNLKRQITISDDDTETQIDTRNFRLTIPVLSKELCTPVVESFLSKTVSHTTRDIVQYNLCHENSTSEIPLPDQGVREGAVSLFSGGLDSTGGVFYNKTHDIDASYLSLNYGSGIGPLTDTICNNVGIERSLVSIHYTKSANEYTQFSRGFLHLMFGVAAAISRGVPIVQSFENGIIARFLILQDGWMTTRTVSPTFIRCFNTFLNEIDSIPITVQNPFQARTKTDVINLIPDSETVSMTTTCPHKRFFNHHDQENCGLCVPCIIRTVSLVASDHAFSLDGQTVHSPFSTADFKQMDLDLEIDSSMNQISYAVDPHVFMRAVAEISYFCRHLLKDREHELIQDYPKLYDPEILALYKKFAHEFEDMIREIEEFNSTAKYLLSLNDPNSRLN